MWHTRARARASRTLTRVSNRLVSRPGSARVWAHAPENCACATNNQQQTTQRTTTTTSGSPLATRQRDSTVTLYVIPRWIRLTSVVLSWSLSLQVRGPSLRAHTHAHALEEARESRRNECAMHHEKGTVTISISFLYLAFLFSHDFSSFSFVGFIARASNAGRKRDSTYIRCDGKYEKTTVSGSWSMISLFFFLSSQQSLGSINSLRGSCERGEISIHSRVRSHVFLRASRFKRCSANGQIPSGLGGAWEARASGKYPRQKTTTTERGRGLRSPKRGPPLWSTVWPTRTALSCYQPPKVVLAIPTP